MTALPDLSGYTPPANLLAERVVLVTGAGSGIGAEVSCALARHGATLVLAGRTVAKLEQVYDRIVAEGGLEPTIYPVDLAGAGAPDYDELKQLLDARFGKLDGLLHNAGDLGQRRPVGNYDPDAWARVMQVNVTAPFLITRALLPLLEQSPDARVLFTSSGVGRRGRAHWGAYAVSKFATEGLMQTLADDLDGVSTVRVNAINPSATRTRMRAAAYPAEDPATVKPVEALLPAYLWLMGPDSRTHHGESFDA